jgi:TPP-dependent 2-oxoacid decarboxylase
MAVVARKLVMTHGVGEAAATHTTRGAYLEVMRLLRKVWMASMGGRSAVTRYRSAHSDLRAANLI